MSAKASVDEIVKSYKNLLVNLKNNPTKPGLNDLRLINSSLLMVHSLFAIVLPVMIRAFTGGVSVVSNDYTCVRLVDEQIRFSGVLSLALVLFNYLSSRWAEVAQRDVMRVMAIVYALGSIVCVLSVYSGGSFFYLIGMLIMSALAFFHAQLSGLASYFKKE